MTTGAWLVGAQKMLAVAAIETARLDCLVLLEDELGMGRAQILAHPEHILMAANLARLNKKIVQRATHVPLAYIRGKANFYGRGFAINQRVLVPRPETETIIELLKTLTLPTQLKIVDVGTGSGCIAITAALEIPSARVVAYDIDADALGIAKQNANTLKANVAFKQQNLFDGDDIDFDVVLANLPYVPEGFPINQAAGFEPPIALFAGNDGLSLYKVFWQQLASARQPHFVLTESLPSQHHALGIIARQAGYYLEQTRGFVQLFMR